MVILSDKLKKLQEIKVQLKQEQEKLTNFLKDKHAELYSWMLQNHIDPANLKDYGANLAVALAISFGASFLKTNASVNPSPKPAEFRVVNAQELYNLSEEKKAAIVWNHYGDVIKTVAEKYDIDYKVIFATIMVESGGNTYAVRNEPAIGDASYGLGQMLYGTARGLGFTGNPQDLFDPKTNIELVGMYHKRNLNVYGNLSTDELIVAYNAGSPYNYPHPGHLAKFNRWLNLVSKVVS